MHSAVYTVNNVACLLHHQYLCYKECQLLTCCMQTKKLKNTGNKVVKCQE